MALFGSKKNPRGPDFRQAREHVIDLSGSKVHFKSPPHSEINVPFKEMTTSYNIYDESIYKERSDIENDIPGIGCYREGWAFQGKPIIESQIGELTFVIEIYHITGKTSLLHPDNLIDAISNVIFVSKGPGNQPDHRSYCRMNWKVQDFNGTMWSHYDSFQAHNLHGSTEWCTSLSNEHLLYFSFVRYINKPNTELNRAYDELIEKIMSTVRIEWSADALQQQAEAMKKWPDAKLPEHLPELTWPEEVWEAHKSDRQREAEEDDKKIAELMRQAEAANGQIKA